MNFLHNSRVVLIRIGKVLPFIVCLLVFVSYTESLFALATEDFIVYDEEIILRKPISWFIGQYFEYNIQMLAVLCIISVAIETCKWNKLACVYLGANLYEKYWFNGHIYDIEVYYVVILVNMLVSGYLIYRGMKILVKNT